MDQVNTLNGVENRNILIVDDDEDSCTLLRAYFKAKGFTAHAVYSGQDAISYLENNEPDLVILDVMMPGLDGWDTFSGIRQYSCVPVLFLTALGTGECAAHALHLGGCDYLRKPFSRLELLARVDALLKTAQPRGAHLRKELGLQDCARHIAITVVIPAYNETRFIGSTVIKACEYANNIIVVDDGSSDNTAEVAEAAGATVVRHSENLGKGAALNTGFKKAREMGAQVVVTLDADGQHLPEELATVVRPVLDGAADIVIGSRYKVYKSDVPRVRIWGHWFFNLFTSLASGQQASDSQSGYRAFSPTALEVIEFNSNGFSVESEMQFIAHENGLRMVEVPITILYQDKPKRSVFSQGMTVLGGIIKIMGQYRPLFYFGLPGAIALVLAVIWGLGVWMRYQQVQQLAVGNALISIALAVIGVILFTTGIMLHSIRGLLVDVLHVKKKGVR